MKILVTGANGYIGRHVVDELIKNGIDVIATDLHCDLLNKKAEIIECDLFSIENPYLYFKKPDGIIHLAWVDGFNHKSSNHLKYLPKHVALLQNLIENGVKNINIMGSMHEIGFYEGKVDENTPTHPLSLYGVAKNTLRETLNVLKQTNDFKLKWLRGFYIYGDDEKNHSIFTNILKKAKEGSTTFPFTTGENKYDFIEVNDLATEIVACSIQEDVTGIINVCSGKPISLKQKTEEFIKRHNLDMKLDYGVYPSRPYDSKFIFGDVTKLFEVLKNSTNKSAKALYEKLKSQLDRSIQIQSIIYKNDLDSILCALDNINNAVGIAKKEVKNFSDVVFVYGDSSPSRVLTDENIAYIKNTFKNIEFKYQYFNRNTGTALGHNLLAQNCQANYIMVMNPDVKVSPHYFKNMFSFFDEHDDCGLVEARQCPIEHQKEYDIYSLKTDWATTACCIFPTSVFKEVDGFDSNSFFMYCDDLDFSWKIRLSGRSIYYSPLAVVYHAKTLSPDGDWLPTSAEIFYSAQAAILMAYKWSNPKRVKYLCKLFSISGRPEQKKAVQHFKEMKIAGTLPKQLDKEHKVARFYGDYYSKNRFIL